MKLRSGLSCSHHAPKNGRTHDRIAHALCKYKFILKNESKLQFLSPAERLHVYNLVEGLFSFGNAPHEAQTLLWESLAKTNAVFTKAPLTSKEGIAVLQKELDLRCSCAHVHTQVCDSSSQLARQEHSQTRTPTMMPIAKSM